MTLQERIDVLDRVGQKIIVNLDQLEALFLKAKSENVWFDRNLVKRSLENIALQYLDGQRLINWSGPYENRQIAKKVGLVLAGSIPLVGIHDIISVFVSGKTALIKLSQKDSVLIRYIIDLIIAEDDRAKEWLRIVEKIATPDAVIATGSDNSSRYFEYYFGKYPHIIRKNRTSVAVLYGDESKDNLKSIAEDVLLYYGLGCRNVSSVMVPLGYDFKSLMESFNTLSWVRENHAYNNNFDYNLAILMMNNIPYIFGETILLTENKDLVSRIATLHYTYYKNLEDVKSRLNSLNEQIQVMVSSKMIEGHTTVTPGLTQCPSLSDYADGVDTLLFLDSI